MLCYQRQGFFACPCGSPRQHGGRERAAEHTFIPPRRRLEPQRFFPRRGVDREMGRCWSRLTTRTTLDRLAFAKMLVRDPPNRLHDHHHPGLHSLPPWGTRVGTVESDRRPTSRRNTTNPRFGLDESADITVITADSGGSRPLIPE